jgi:response regulator RpfG family c-di-GMP phosphodiesterase
VNSFSERHVVVLVDDEPEVLSALFRSLRREPYRVLATSDPERALRWVEDRDVSVVITDQRMPAMEGTDLLGRVLERSPRTARVVLTAFARSTGQTPGLRRSIDCLIEKPWDDAMLRKTIRDFLREREGEGVAEPEIRALR